MPSPKRPAEELSTAFKEESSVSTTEDLSTTVEVLQVSHDPTKRHEFLKDQRMRVIQPLAQKTTKGDVLQMDTVEVRELLNKLDKLLTWLETDVTMSEALKKNTQIDVGLKLIFGTPRYQFPEVYSARARALHEKWTAENWGASEVQDEANTESSDEDAGEQTGRRDSVAAKRARVENTGVKTTTVRFPSPDHPIWGKDGIMHGVALTGRARRTYKLDPRYKQRTAKVYGHNGLNSGDWFPYQIIALFRGAHGSAMGGVSGNTDLGAYSIVVAGMYDDLDQDRGNVIFYSGSNSHDNTNPNAVAPSSSSTRALQASLASGKPVRVLRSATGKSRFAPTYGLRYDGLYTIVDVREPINGRGGKYEQFKLERIEGQPEIAVRSRPTLAEVHDYQNVARGY